MGLTGPDGRYWRAAQEAREESERATGSHVEPGEENVVAFERLDRAAEKWPAHPWPGFKGAA